MNLKVIKNKIYTIRNKQVMLDEDLAKLYQVDTKVFNQAVKRNINRFPVNFCFQLTKEEYSSLRSQIVTSKRGGRQYLPYVFTEHGVAMLAGVLNSETAIRINIEIINAFVLLRKVVSRKLQLGNRMSLVEDKLVLHDTQIEKLFKKLEPHIPEQAVFYDGQMHQAAVFLTKIISSAKERVILVDNYVNAITIDYLKNTKVDVEIYTKDIPKLVSVPKNIKIREYKDSHDRFLIIDDDMYLVGASLKDAGKKMFGIVRMDKEFAEKLLKMIE